MKRPILVAIIGYIIGIIVGLYFNKSIVLFYVPIIVIYILKKLYEKIWIKEKKEKIKANSKLKLFSIKRYMRYLKLFLNLKTILLIIVFSIISNSVLIFENNKYERIYGELENLNNSDNVELVGIVISNCTEKQYYNKYKIETEFNKQTIRLYIMVNKKIKLEYGDKVILSGKYIKPQTQRNYMGFDYLQYLKQLKICGTIKCTEAKLISKNNGNPILRLSNSISNNLKSRIGKLLDKEHGSILMGLLLGDKEQIDEDIQENFKNASMSHILAVSGMHVLYIVLGIKLIFNRIIGKRKTNILIIIFLVFYMFLADFSPSITRAGIMGIMMIFSKIVYRKNDIYTSISFSLLLILIYNPFLIQNTGLALSYGGVIGIVIFNKTILSFLNNIKIKNKIYKYFIRPKISLYIDNIKKIISISLSVQLVIFPIILYNFNLLNPYFLITNLFLSLLVGPIIISGLVFTLISVINFNIAQMTSGIIQFNINILNFLSSIGKLPFSKILIPTPSLFSILFYYLTLMVSFYIFNIYLSKKPNRTQIRVKNLIALMKIKTRKNKKRMISIFLVINIIFISIRFIPHDLQIYFIDVQQGDSCLIVTPNNKTILIDGGGNDSSDFDVGKSTLIPYILDRGFTSIDFIVISHFDSDHVGGLLSVMEELKVGQVIISKQREDSENYQKFKSIVKNKKIKVTLVKKQDKLKIENDLYFNFLWPNDENLIQENMLNNNSIVCKLIYKNFSMLFTGDIEEKAEKQILQEYRNNLIALNSTILKVGHHGSKTSSTKEFIQAINPKIALIGVGENNKFGHPNNEVINRLEELKTNIYRTDKNGEITIEINNKGGIKVINKSN